MPYQPIENYGIIGDQHTVALVGLNGSIDWFCFPHFDSPSVFCAILDDSKGGRFRISPAEEGAREKQFYFPETNVLITRFLAQEGVGEISDFMRTDRRGGDYHQIIRRVTVVRGSMKFRLECHPAFDYARAEHVTEIQPEGALFRAKGLTIALSTRTELKAEGTGVSAEFTLKEGQSATFVLAGGPDEDVCLSCLTEEESNQAFKQTVDYWRHWVSQCNYRGRWREMVTRSALALKLMTFEPTGAIVASPTTSLPEDIGGSETGTTGTPGFAMPASRSMA